MLTEHIKQRLSVAQRHSKHYFSYNPDKDMFTQQKKKQQEIEYVLLNCDSEY